MLLYGLDETHSRHFTNVISFNPSQTWVEYHHLHFTDEENEARGVDSWAHLLPAWVCVMAGWLLAPSWPQAEQLLVTPLLSPAEHLPDVIPACAFTALTSGLWVGESGRGCNMPSDPAWWAIFSSWQSRPTQGRKSGLGRVFDLSWFFTWNHQPRGLHTAVRALQRDKEHPLSPGGDLHFHKTNSSSHFICTIFTWLYYAS